MVFRSVRGEGKEGRRTRSEDEDGQESLGCSRGTMREIEEQKGVRCSRGVQCSGVLEGKEQRGESEEQGKRKRNRIHHAEYSLHSNVHPPPGGGA